MRAARVRTVLSVLLADARRHRLQTATTLLGIATGTAVVVAIHLASAAALDAFRRALLDWTGRATHQVRATQPLPAARLAELAAAPGVLAAQPVIETTLVVPPADEQAAREDPLARVGGGGPDGARPLRLLGLDPFLARPFLPAPPDGAPEPDAATGELFARLLVEPGLALAPSATLAQLGLPPQGGPLRARGPAGPTELRLLPLPGELLGDVATPLALCDLATAAEALGLHDRVLRIDLVLAEGADPGALPLRDGERLERPERKGERASTMTQAFRSNLLALGLLALLVGAFLVFNMAQFAVTRRRALLGKLRCLGCAAADLRAAVLAEAAVLGLLGGALGLAAGRALAGALVGDVTRTVSTLYGPVESASVALDAGTAALALALAVAACVAATLAPAASAARTPPVLLAGGAPREPLPPAAAPWLMLAGGLALLLPLPLPPLLTGLLLPSLAVLLLLLAAATAVPRLLGALLPRVPRTPVLALAADHVGRSLARAGAAAGALAMPIAMTVAIVSMVGSFRSEVRAWSDATLRGDLYVGPAFQEVAPYTARLPAGLLEALDALPEAAAVDARRVAEEPLGESLFLVTGARLDALQAHAELRFLQGEPQAAFAAARAGAALVSEPLARRLSLEVGSELELRAGRAPRRLRVAGVFQDFAFDRGYALLDEAAFLEVYGETGVCNAALTLRPGADAQELRARLARQFPDAEVIAVAALRAGVGRAFDQTFAITWVLQAISTVLALAGVLTALLALNLERRTELGVLRALGASARTLRRLLLAEAALLLAVAAAAALPTGVALAWILVAVVNTRSFGWSFPLLVPAGEVAQVVALALAAGLVAGLLPWMLVRRARIAALLGPAAALLLLAWPARAQHGAPGPALPDDGFARALPGRTWSFPADHGSHPDTRTEWWYLTGPLRAADGRLFGFQATWFRRALLPQVEPGRSPLAARDVFLFHGALTDVTAGTLRAAEQASRGFPAWAGAAQDALDVHLLGHRWHTPGGDLSRTRVEYAAGDARLALELDLAGGTPLLHGLEPGLSPKGHEPGQASWYASVPRLAVRGTLELPGEAPLAVTGEAWFDHEFGSSQLSGAQVGWDWFAVSLDDGSDLMLYRLRLADGSGDTTSAGTLRDPAGRRAHLAHDAFVLREEGRWTSPHTGASYPSGWSLSVPGEALELRVTPVLADQELRTPGSTGVTYWEGLCRFVGTRAGKPVEGMGYVELVGYDARFVERL